MTELSSIGDTVVISVTKDGIKFSTSGDIGSANVTCRQNTSVDKQVLSRPVTEAKGHCHLPGCAHQNAANVQWSMFRTFVCFATAGGLYRH